MIAIVEAQSQIKIDNRYQSSRQNKHELDHKLFLDLLTGKITQEEEAEHRSLALHWPSVPARLITLQLEDEGRNSSLLEIKQESQIREASKILECHYIQNAVVCRKKSCFCIVDARFPKELLIKVTQELITKTKEINNCSCFAVISEEIFDYLEIPAIYETVTESFLIRKIKKEKKELMFLSSLQYDRILLHTAHQEETRDFVQKKLGLLEEYDRAHESSLLETIDMLTQKHGSRKQTAEALFLHRNTMAHRIHKIEEILNISLDDMEELQQLEFACKVRPYIQ